MMYPWLDYKGLTYFSKKLRDKLKTAFNNVYDKITDIYNEINGVNSSIKEINNTLGDTDISEIDGGTLTGAVSELNSALDTTNKNVSQNASDISSLNSALTDGSVTKVGTSTVGSGTRPMYLSSGTPTASSSTVGSGTKPVYLSSGTVTASSSTVGSSSNPVYLNSGTITACNMSSVFRVGVVSTDNVTISASSNYSYSVNASLSGYTPQAVISYSISNASSSGTMSSWCNVFGYWLTDNTAYANIRNTSTSTDAKVQIQLWILYGAS